MTGIGKCSLSSRLQCFNKVWFPGITTTRCKHFYPSHRQIFLCDNPIGGRRQIFSKDIKNLRIKGLFHCSSSLWTESVGKGLIVEPDEYVQSVYDGLVSHDRGSLARAITLIETSNPKKKLQAKALLNLILHNQKANEVHSVKGPKTFRIGWLMFPQIYCLYIFTGDITCAVPVNYLLDKNSQTLAWLD